MIKEIKKYYHNNILQQHYFTDGDGLFVGSYKMFNSKGDLRMLVYRTIKGLAHGTIINKDYDIDKTIIFTRKNGESMGVSIKFEF